MSKKSLKVEEMPEQEKSDMPSSRSLIGRNVIATLGQPPNMSRVVVLPLWQGCFRVNVFIGQDPLNTSIAHSYFVKAGDDGAILESTPKIIRVYH